MENKFIIVLGRKGQGKSHWVKWYVKEKKRLVIFDPQKQFSSCGVIITNFVDLCRYIQKVKYGNFRIVYQPKIDLTLENNRKVHFKKFIRAICILHQITYVIDELHLCKSKNAKDNEWFEQMIDAGRHVGQSMIATTLRYANVATDIRGQADEYVLFQTNNYADLTHFSNELGPEAKKINRLPPFHYLYYRDGEIKFLKPVK